MNSLPAGEFESVRTNYDQNGWCQLPRALDMNILDSVRGRVENIAREVRPEVVLEAGTEVVRALHGCHLFDRYCAALTRLPQFVNLAEILLGESVYVYQFKVNMKEPFEGKAWPWHQDFAFWSREDGMPAPVAVNIAVLLDDVREDNGPLTLIPGSHPLGLLDKGSDSTRSRGDWHQHVSADLEYVVDDVRVEDLKKDLGLHTALGSRGTCFAFHPSIVHSSTSNRSGNRRAMLLITYNAVSNAPKNPSRPEFLVGREAIPVIPSHDFAW
jgi:ectoine hydroxylase